MRSISLVVLDLRPGLVLVDPPGHLMKVLGLLPVTLALDDKVLALALAQPC